MSGDASCLKLNTISVIEITINGTIVDVMVESWLYDWMEAWLWVPAMIGEHLTTPHLP
jgi:hypothetical protein